VPDKRLRVEPAVTDQRHKYKLHGVPSVLRVRLLNCGDPRTGLSCTVVVDGRKIPVTTHGDGWLEGSLMPDVTEGLLKIDSTGEEYPFTIGTARPKATIEGLQKRLHNLGYYEGPLDGTMTDETAEAIRQFQLEREMPLTGEFDSGTRDELIELHGS